MAKTASMYIRIDPDIKSDVESIYARYGMSITDAINVFLYASRNIGGLPFDLRPSVPNAVTIEAIEEVQEMKRNPQMSKSFDSVEALFEDLKDDEDKQSAGIILSMNIQGGESSVSDD